MTEWKQPYEQVTVYSTQQQRQGRVQKTVSRQSSNDDIGSTLSMAYVINIPNLDEDPVSNQTHPTLGVDISDYSARPPLDKTMDLARLQTSLRLR
jgi:hypothetical protein